MASDDGKKDSGMLSAIAFLLFFIGFASIVLSAGFTNMALLIFVLFGSISMLAGISMTASSRSYLGLPFLLIFFFIFTSQQPAIIGQAIFGYWWPQVSSITETFMGPLNTALSQAQVSLGKAWMMMTNPQQYYLDLAAENAATKSVIMTGGTPMSIEINKFDLLTSMTGTLDPLEPVIGSLYLENQGDFVSGELNLSVSASWVKPEDSTEHKTGSISNLQCSNSNSGNVKDSDKKPGQEAYCFWNNKTYPSESRAVTFKIDEDSWSFEDGNDNINECQYSTDGTNKQDCSKSGWTCFDCNTNKNVTYKKGGNTVKVKANLTYDYVVNVSLPIRVMGIDLYLDRLSNGDMVLQDVTSEYTGGPVKATLFTQSQPARTDIPFLVVASLYNDGTGDLVNITNFTIIVYGGDVIDNVTFIATTFRNDTIKNQPTPAGCGSNSVSFYHDPVAKTFNLTCENTYGIIKPGEFKRVSFYLHPIQNITEERTTQIVGIANYKYRRTTSQSLTVSNAPPQ